MNDVILTCYNLNIQNSTGKLREFCIKVRDAYVESVAKRNRDRKKSKINWDREIAGETLAISNDKKFIRVKANEQHNKKTTTSLAPVHPRTPSRSRKQKEVKVSGRQRGRRSRNQSRGGSS